MRASLTFPEGLVTSEEDQRAQTPPAQATAWFRLLLAMTLPTLFLLFGISLTR